MALTIERALQLIKMFWERSPKINMCSVGKMKRKLCFLPAPTKKKILQRSAKQLLAKCVCLSPPPNSKDLVTLLQVNEILRLIYLICLRCSSNSHSALIENRASSTVSYQTACRTFKHATPVCCRNFQFKVFLRLMNSTPTS